MATAEPQATPSRPPAFPTWPHAAFIAMLLVWGVLSRLPYLTDCGTIGNDGQEYLDSLALDENYNVPSPGNIGFVLLARGAQLLGLEPLRAYSAVLIAMTCLALAFVYLLGTRFMPRYLAALAAFAFSCDTVVWYHGTLIKSYPVWMVALPAVAFFGSRFFERHRTGDVVAMSLALGLCSIARNDVILFGGPLWAGCLLLGRARPGQWLIGTALVGVCVAAWLFATAWVLGGPEVLLALLQEKEEIIIDKGLRGKGIIDGLLRNMVKFGVILLWSAHLALVPFAYGLWRDLRSYRIRWPALTLAGLWVLPAWSFAFIAMFLPPQIFQFTPLVYLGAVRGLQLWARPGNNLLPVAGALVITVVSAVQFNLLPLLPDSNQRNVIINVTFLKWTGTGLRNEYLYVLRLDKKGHESHYDIDPSLKSILRQLVDPEPVPRIPPGRRGVEKEPPPSSPQ